jgi:hypothetical protein
MLANGGEIDGVRILSEKLVQTFNIPRSNAEEVDPVMFGFPVPISIAGYWLGGNYPPVTCAKTPSAICHPGAGNSMAWADMDTGLAVSICHKPHVQPFQHRAGSDGPDCRRGASGPRARLTQGADMGAPLTIVDFDDPDFDPFWSSTRPADWTRLMIRIRIRRLRRQKSVHEGALRDQFRLAGQSVDHIPVPGNSWFLDMRR